MRNPVRTVTKSTRGTLKSTYDSSQLCQHHRAAKTDVWYDHFIILRDSFQARPALLLEKITEEETRTT